MSGVLWGYVGVTVGAALAIAFTVDPELVRERRRPAAGGIDRWRRVPMIFFALAHLAVAVLDIGWFHWSDSVPGSLRAAGLAGYAAAAGWLAWAVAVNRFFSPIVRVQTERAHRLVSTGPYRHMRHPGYLGMIVATPASALALGSWWALVPAAVCSLFVLRRVAVEDRFLHEHLEGYGVYAQAVRHRLVPGVW